MRITVYDVLGWLASGMTEQEILRDFPELEPEDIQIELEEVLGVSVDLLTPGDLPVKYRAQVLKDAVPV